MSEMRQIPHSLKEMDSFSRQEYTDAMASNSTSGLIRDR